MVIEHVVLASHFLDVVGALEPEFSTLGTDVVQDRDDMFVDTGAVPSRDKSTIQSTQISARGSKRCGDEFSSVFKLCWIVSANAYRGGGGNKKRVLRAYECMNNLFKLAPNGRISPDE